MERDRGGSEPVTARWLAAHVAGIDPGSSAMPRIALDPARRIPGFDLWDMWPIEIADGRLADFGGMHLWMVLAAPAAADPEDRHDHARIRFLSERDGRWRLHDPVFPDGYTPGSREWSGSAVFHPGTQRLTTFFTAAGRRDAAGRSFEQRLFQATATLRLGCGVPQLVDRDGPHESLIADERWYMRANQTCGGAGTIKGFRDPAWFRDPHGRGDFLLFTASCAQSRSAWNGVIGIAEATGDPAAPWRALPPLVSADGLNNELERPHIRVVGGRYYLFWSTQRKVFADGGPAGPTGLYAMVGDGPLGPFAPVNGTGLVAANPPSAPAQAYSWWVLDDLRVNGFVDLPETAEPPALSPGADRRARFGGYPAPFFSLSVEGERVDVRPA